MSTERHRILTVFKETTERSALPLVVGAKPLDGADVWATADGILRLRTDHVSMRILLDGPRRILRGACAKHRVTVEGRYALTDDGTWRETASLVAEYPDREAFDLRAMPERRLSTVHHADATITTRIQRLARPENDEEKLEKATCVTRRDRSRVEEQESILRVQDRSRYDLVRKEFDARRRKEKSLEYRYPWQPNAFYAQIWHKLVDLAMSSQPWRVVERAPCSSR